MYRGEIQNDSNGGNYNRSLDYTATSGGLGAGGRYETRNFAVGASLRGCGENEETEQSDDDPCWDGYEMIGTKEKRGKTVPNCVPVSGDGKPFTKEQLTKIILDKNKVIADLEENAYGEGFWEDVRAGLVKRNERKKTTPISEEDWKKQMEDYEKPTENWGMDELDGGAMVGGAPKPQPPITGVEAQHIPFIHSEDVAEGVPEPTEEEISVIIRALDEANNFAERGVPAGPLAVPKQMKYQRDFRQAPCIRNTQLKDAVAQSPRLLPDMSRAATNDERRAIIAEEVDNLAEYIIDTVLRMPGNFVTNINVVMSRIQAETTATVGQSAPAPARGNGFSDDDDDDDDELVGGAPKPRPPLKPLPKQLKPLPPAGSTSIPGAYLTDTTSDPRAPPPPPLPVSVLDYRRADDFSVPVVGQPAAAILPIRPSSQSDRLEIRDALIQANQAGLFAVGILPRQASSNDKRSAYDAAFSNSLTTSSEIWKFLTSAPDGPAMYEQIYRNRDDANRTIDRFMGDIGDGIKTVVSELGGDFNDVIREIQRQTASDVTALKEARKRYSKGSGVGQAVNPLRKPLVPPEEASGMTEEQKQTVLDALLLADDSGRFNVDVGMRDFVLGDHQQAYSDGFLVSLGGALGSSYLTLFFRTDMGRDILNYLKANWSNQAERTAYINRRLDEICTELVETAKISKVKVSQVVDSIKKITEMGAKRLVRDKQKASGAGQGGAATKPEAKPSPVAAIAAATKPVREAIQNGIGDAIYGKETDPRKQKKGLLGISEEGKEESKKKVMKNIVAPLAKTGMEVAKGVKNEWNAVFNKDQFEADKKAEEQAKFKKYEREIGVVRNKEGVIVKAPRYYDTNRPEEIGPDGIRASKYNTNKEFLKKQPSYVRIPNPIKAAGLRPSSRELELDDIKLWEPQFGQQGQIGVTLKDIQDDEFIFVPEADVKKIYSELRGFVEQEKGKELATGFEELGWTKGEMRDFGKMAADFKSFTPQEKREYLQVKNLQEKQQLKNALAKVDKDIADEEAKKPRTEIRGERPVQVGSEPDQARLAKMRDAKAKIIKLQENKAKDAQRQFKMDADAMEIEKQQREEEYRRNLKNTVAAPEVLPGEAPEASPYEQEEADNMAEFKALSPAERSLQLDAYRKELQKLGYSEQQIQEAVGVVGGAKPVQMKQDDYYKEHQNIVKLLKNTGKSLLSEAKDQQEEASAMAKKMNAPDPFDGELVGEGGAVEYSLQTAARKLFNPTGNMTMAGKQTFTPDYDAYGDTIEDGRENAFALSRSMYSPQAIEIPGFDYYEGNASIRFYVKDDENVVMVGIRGTNKRNWRELLATWASMVPELGPDDLSFTSRFQEDLRSLQEFQKEFPQEEFYYVATGHSLGGAIADRFLDMGLISEALTYNPAIEKKYILDGNIHNHRVYLDTDPLFILMGQFAPNTEIRVNASKADFYNPIKEGEYLVNSHQINPSFNPAFEGGGMMGAGKTYTIEEWKRIFDARLEQKRQQIEARAAKKKDTAKAKRARAKERRDERAEIPELETPFRTSRVMKATPPKAPEPEPEPEKEYPVTRYKMDGNDVYVSDAEEGVRFEDRVVVDYDDNQLGTLGTMKELAKKVRAKEKRAQKKSAPPAPASARVELREELVAEQPRNPEGVFVAENVIVSRPQKSLGVPTFTEGEKRMIRNLQARFGRSEMTAVQKAKLLARSGIASKLMEMLAVAPSDSSQGVRELKAIVGKQQKRVEGEKVRELYLPEDIEEIFRKQQEGLTRRINRMGPRGLGENVYHSLFSIEVFARCGFGCLNLVAECMAADPFDVYLAAGRVERLRQQNKSQRELTLMMNMTKADEDYSSSVGFWSQDTRPVTSMNFGLEKNPSDFLVELTETCMLRLTGIDGIRAVNSDTKNAGMGFKRRNQFQVFFEGVGEVKRFTEAVKSEYTAKIQSEVVPKIRKLADDLKPKMLARAKMMMERILFDLPPAAAMALSAYQQKTGKELPR